MPDDAWGALAPEEKVSRVKSVWVAGISAAQLSARLSDKLGCRITRHAIIGLYHRKKIALAAFPLPPRTTRGSGPSRTAARPRSPSKRNQPRGFEPFADPAPIITPASAAKYDATALNLLLVDLGPQQCHWPVNDGGPFLFCGHRTELGSSWCPHHAKRLVGAGTNSERTAIKDAGRAAA